MGERTSYPHGTFSWVENATSDQEGAKSFYSELFGWDWEDSPVGDGVYYSMAKLEDKFVAAIAPQQPDEAKMGIPPHWNSYITVDDVDAVSARVEDLGGKLHAPPFDVMDVGRMSAISDATGAVVYLWQAKQHIGAGLVNVPNAFCWNELATREPERAQEFWSQLLGWTYEQVSDAPAYWSIRNGDHPNGGMRVLGDELPPQTPAHWIVYFAVESIDAAAPNAGTQLVPKTKAGGENSFAVFSDPFGAVFALFEGVLDE